jgi:hypothetical protein
MKTFKTYEDFLNESFLFEAKESKKSKISPNLDNLMENKWKLATMKKLYKEKNGDAWEKHDEEVNAEIDKIKDKYRDKDDKLPKDISKVVEEINARRKEMRKAFIKDVVSKDPAFKDEVNDYYEKQDRFEELGNKLNKVGFDKFKKENAKEYEELLDLQADHMNPVRIESKPGGIMQISTTNMERGGDEGKPGFVELPDEVGADAFQRKMKTFIDKNGKPKGVIMDLRSNTGGKQDIAKSMTDFFVDSDDYEIESQKFNYGPRIWKDDPDGLEKYKKSAWDPLVMDHLNKLDEEGQKKYWEEAKEKGYFELPNKRKNTVESKYRLTGIPTVLQTSTKTFSAGEFASDTIKNLNPNVVHIGTNSGGGANQTFGGLPPDGYDEDGVMYWDNAKKSGTERAKLVAKAFKDTYHDAKVGENIHDEIIKQIESGKIKDDMDSDKLTEILKPVAVEASGGDNHVNMVVEPNGSIFPLVPQVKSDRVIVDPKTRKPILKDGKPQFKGNWEQTGVGASGTAPFVESDANTATRDALEILYDKTGQKDLAKKLKEKPEEFGISKDGKDGVFDDNMDAHKSYYAHKHLSEEDGEYSERQAKQLELSKKSAEETDKAGILSKMKAAEKAFSEQAEGKKVNVEEVGISKIYSSIDPKVAEQMKKQPVPIRIPGKKPKMVQRQTILDFVPVDNNDPGEIAMLAAQKKQYLLMQAYRIKNKLTPLEDYEVWYQKKLVMSQDNKDYRDRKKAKLQKELKKKSPAVKESHVSEFDYFLAEEECIKKFWDIAAQTEIIAD